MYLLLILATTFFGCKTSQNIDSETAFWGELESDQNYLYRTPAADGIVESELNIGSILLFIIPEGDFYKVKVNNNLITKKFGKQATYWLYKPKYKRLYDYSSKTSYEKIIRSTLDITRNYFLGERGGCYYLNSQENRIYVDKSFCDSFVAKTKSDKKTTVPALPQEEVLM